MVAILSLLVGGQEVFAQQRKLGLGLSINEPTGIIAKLWTSNVNAFAFGLGWSARGDRFGKHYSSYNGDNRVHVHMDYLWHSFEAIRTAEQLPLYYGIGGRLNSGAGYGSSLAARGIIGVAWIPQTMPIDIFLELVPSFQFTSTTGSTLDAAIGARYFFR